MIDGCINGFYGGPENSLSCINSTSIRHFSLCLNFLGGAEVGRAVREVMS